MDKTTKTLIWVSGGILLLAGIILAVVYLVRKNKASQPSTFNPSPSPTGNIPAIINDGKPCVPYTDEMQKRDIQNLRSKCGKFLTIPVVGIGKYWDCMNKGKGQLPPINNCF